MPNSCQVLINKFVEKAKFFLQIRKTAGIELRPAQKTDAARSAYGQRPV